MITVITGGIVKLEGFYNVKGDTWCIDLKHTLIGIYKINKNDVVMLDSGICFGNKTNYVIDMLESENLNVKAIIATHGHFDHIGNNKKIVEKYNCKVYMYGAEAYMGKDTNSIKFERTPLPFKEIENIADCLINNVNVFIKPNENSIEVYGKKFDIIHTPGHSKSHIVIITPDNIAMLGDAVMTTDEIEKTKIPYAANFLVDFDTKKKLLSLNCDKYIISHKGIRDDISYDVNNNIDYIQRRAKAILSCIKQNMSYDDIVASVIKNMSINIDSRFTFSDIYGMIAPYVQYLEETERLKVIYDNGYIRYNC